MYGVYVEAIECNSSFSAFHACLITLDEWFGTLIMRFHMFSLQLKDVLTALKKKF